METVNESGNEKLTSRAKARSWHLKKSFDDSKYKKNVTLCDYL